MKHRTPNPKIICYASIFALSLTACSNSGKVKDNVNLSDNAAKESTSHLVKLKKGHRTNKLTGKFPDPRSYDNLWDRLFDRFDLPEVSHPDIDRELSWFMNHPTYIERVQSRAEPFLYSIVKQLEKQHMPAELALLPVIESAFQPHAVSPARAAGIWQFIPTTGRHYGLKQSYSYDGRRDIYASTRAAIKYLKKLHNDFNGDWLLAIAGYNCGEGAVGRAIQRNLNRGLPTDFWSLDLPQETRTYVPRLLAVAKLFSEAEQYGISLRPIPNKALYKTVIMKDQVDLALAANAADISLDKLFELNPGFKRQKVDVDGSYRLFIPAHKKIVDFKEDLARQVAAQTNYEQANNPPNDDSATGKPAVADSVSPTPVSPAQTPDVPAPVQSLTTPDTDAQAPQPDEKPVLADDASNPDQPAKPQTAGKKPRPQRQLKYTDNATDEPLVLAAKDEMPTQNEISSADRRESPEPVALAQLYTDDTPASSGLSVASYERIATAGRDRQASVHAAKTARKSPDEPSGKEHSKPSEHETAATVDKEDRNLERVGHKTALKPREAASDDRKQPEPDLAGKKLAYVVHEGDTLYSIARKHDMDVEDLKKLNRVSDADDIKWGQSMKVVAGKDAGKKLPGPKLSVPAYKSGLQNTKYTAHDGETLFSISRRFNVTVADLRKWNGIKADKQFRAGSNINVSGEKD